MRRALSRKPESSVGLIVCPHLTSSKIKNGTRGEIRRIEDKADGKRLWTQAIILRMGEPPANKQVPINFTGWICMDEATKEHNIFAGCPMAIDGGNREPIPWNPEREYVIPSLGKDSTPSTAEGSRRGVKLIGSAPHKKQTCLIGLV
ncbi:unnamed protein product [Effrenium voratum]|uniref:Uncharacterized protein n=1 Tax=Effrenium voratum TaxID=2562239 RepID=A0AA36J5V0_9DINO|nr:unnamed protein product [Effrenium voratum]